MKNTQQYITPTQDVAAKAANAGTPGRPMPRWEIHFRFWMWVCFTIGGCYVFYAFQEAIIETNHIQPLPQSYLYCYAIPLWHLFFVISLFATMPEGELLKPLRLTQSIPIIGGMLAFFGMLFILNAIPTSWTNLLPWSASQAEAFAKSIFLNPLSVILIGVFVLQAHVRKWHKQLQMVAKQNTV